MFSFQGSGGLISYGLSTEGNLGGTFAVDTQGGWNFEYGCSI